MSCSGKHAPKQVDKAQKNGHCAHFFAPPKKPLIKNSIFFQLVLKGLPLHMQTGCALGYVPPAAVEHGAYRFLLNALDIVLQGLARLKVCATPVHGLAGRGQVQELCCKAAVPIHH